MDHLAPYRIPFVGLKPGRHLFKMEVDSAFFTLFSAAELEHARGVAHVELHKIGQTLESQVQFIGKATLPCDRCLGPLEIDLDFEEQLISRLGTDTDLEGEVWVLGTEIYELDLSQPLFEWCHLHLPSKRVHAEESDCNSAFTEYLERDEPAIENDDETLDPRWNALKDLK